MCTTATRCPFPDVRFNTEVILCSLTYLIREIFNALLGFHQPTFFPHLAASFIFKVIIRIFVEHATWSAVRKALGDDVSLATHTSVFLRTPYFAVKYRWFDSAFCPFGQAVTQQCRACGTLRKLKLLYSKDRKSCQVRCTRCGEVYSIRRDPDYAWEEVDATSRTGVVYTLLWGIKPASGL
jgi:hypothetical protein